LFFSSLLRNLFVVFFSVVTDAVVAAVVTDVVTDVVAAVVAVTNPDNLTLTSDEMSNVQMSKKREKATRFRSSFAKKEGSSKPWLLQTFNAKYST